MPARDTVIRLLCILTLSFTIFFFSFNQTLAAPGDLIGAWQHTGPMSLGRCRFEAVVVNDYLYAIGGEPRIGWQNQHVGVERTDVNPDGSLSAWEEDTPLPGQRTSMGAVAYQDFIYVIGGWDEQVFDSVLRASVLQNGSLTDWVNVSTLSLPMTDLAVAGSNEHLYAIAGTTIQRTTINQDGSLQTWVTDNQHLNQTRWFPDAVAVDGYLYVLGGYTGSQALSTVEMAVINPDGSLGEFTLTNSMTVPRTDLAVIETDGYLYALGGHNGLAFSLAHDSVERSKINQDGSLGPWSVVSHMQDSRLGLEAVKSQSQTLNLFALGGTSLTVCRSTVEMIQVETDVVADPIEVTVTAPSALTLNQQGWYAQNPALLEVEVVNHTDQLFWGEVEVDITNSDRLVFTLSGESNHLQAPEQLVGYIEAPGLNPQTSKLLQWQMWAQPMSGQKIEFTATAFDGFTSEPMGTGLVSMTVPTASIHPVVVIPGMMGSWKNSESEWVLDPIFGRYDNLLDELQLAGYQSGISLFPFPYDWRQHITNSGVDLGRAIDGFLINASDAQTGYVDSSSVDLVSHSQGGLVSRAYIQSAVYDNDVHQLITLGTPHRGSPEAYVGAEGLEYITEGFPVIRNIKDTLFRGLAKKSGYCTNRIRFLGREAVCWPTRADLYTFILEQIPSARQLFPDSTYLQNDVGGYLLDNNNPSQVYPFGYQTNTFLDSLNADVGLLVERLGGENVVAVVGDRKKIDTDSYYEVIERNMDDFPLWSNGRVFKGIEFRKSGSGDRTVPKISADLRLVDERVQIKTISESDDKNEIVHGNMPSQLQQTVVKLLTNTQPFFAAGYWVRYLDPVIPNLLVFNNLSPVEILVTDPLGRQIGVGKADIPGAIFSRSDQPDEPDLIIIPDEVEGDYQIELFGTDEGEYTVAMQLLTSEGILTIAEFSGATSPGEHHQHTMEYDSETLPAVPLTLQWYPPIVKAKLSVPALRSFSEGGESLTLKRKALPIKFTIRDALGNVVIDDSVFLWITNPANLTQTIAAFSTDGPGLHGSSDTIRFDENDQHYIVNLHLKDYVFIPGQVYIISAGIYGQELESTSFVP